MPDDPRNPELERRIEAWASSRQGNLQPELERRLHGALADSPAPVRPLPSQGMLTLTFLVVFAVLTAATIAIMKMVGIHLMTSAANLSMTAIFTGAGLLFSRELARKMIPGSRRSWPQALTFALPAIAAFGGLAVLFPWRQSDAFVSEGWHCALLEVVIAASVAALFWLLARRGILFSSPGLGGVLVGLAVSLALVPVQVQCMFLQAPHLLVWHAGTALLLIGLGAVIGRLQRGLWRV
jgi:Negative regulator of sigma F